VCPVEAIYYEDDVPAEQATFREKAPQFFIELGSPGGAAKVGQKDFDPEFVKNLPAKES
jgi:hypothetical protein